jgi:hypothetical protein
MTTALDDLQTYVPGQPERETQVSTVLTRGSVVTSGSLILPTDQFTIPHFPLCDVPEGN